jgi:hypothetical protein
LGRDATELALVKPVAGNTVFDDDALELLVDVSGGHPYLIQLLGWATWDAADGARRIREEHARAGVAGAKAEMAAQFQETWSALTDFQRAYLIACARLGSGPVDSAGVAGALQRSTKQVSPIRQQLLDRQLISVPRYGQVEIGNPLLALWVKDQPAVEVRRR